MLFSSIMGLKLQGKKDIELLLYFLMQTGYTGSMNNSSLDLLKTFVTFAASDNMNETAQKLGISQPAVTFQLKKLEEELPAPVFSMSGNRKVLTHFGRALFNTLEGKFSEIDLVMSRLNNLYASPENYSFKVGGRKEVLSRLLPKMKILGTLEVLDLNEEEVVHDLLQHKIDIAITFEQINRPGLFHKKLFTDHGLFCIHRRLLGDYRFNGDLIRNLNFLRETPVIIYNRKFPYIKEWLEACGGKTNELKVRCIYEDWNDIVKLVAEGQGYSIIPSEVQIPQREDIFYKEIPTEIIPASSFYAIYHKEMQDLGVVDSMFSAFKA